jgi:minor structural protein GP20
MADEDTTPPTDPPPDTAGDDWIPPSKEDWDKTQKALAKANAEAKQRREQFQAAQRQTEDDTGKAVREAQEAAEKKLKPVAVRAAAKAAFLEAGLQGGSDRVAKMVKLLDLEALEIDDDGEVTGLTEQVAAVKTDYPELFGTQTRAPRVSASDRPGTNGRTLTTGEKIAAMVNQ